MRSVSTVSQPRRSRVVAGFQSFQLNIQPPSPCWAANERSRAAYAPPRCSRVEFHQLSLSHQLTDARESFLGSAAVRHMLQKDQQGPRLVRLLDFGYSPGCTFGRSHIEGKRLTPAIGVTRSKPPRAGMTG